MKKILRVCFISLLLLSLGSCGSSKRSSLSYFTNIDDIEKDIIVGDYNIKIEKADELFITVTSQTPEVTAIYNLPSINPATSSELTVYTSPRQQTYVVDSEGNIDFPVLGTIHVAGMTIDQLRDYLVERISKEIVNPVVKVELVNFIVNVAGEVTKPGEVIVTRRRFSILDALSAVGDLTQYGDRSNILIIREEDGKRVHARLNLNDAAILESPYFFLKQNDYVYVDPNDIKRDNSKYNTNNAYKLQVTSTIVSACSVIASLVIALTVK